MPEIYLDNAATTRTDRDLAMELGRDLVELYGNPSSSHRPGRLAAERLARARALLEEELFPGHRAVFTASGSEALALVLRGAWYARQATGGGRRVVCSAVEHPAVLQTLRELERHEGAVLQLVPVTGTGQLDLSALEELLRKDGSPAVVACMHVQNELGTVMPLARVGELLRHWAPAALFVVDSAQGLGKVPVEPASWGADAVTFASHKIHGPKGAGAALLGARLQAHGREGRLRPVIPGGGQEYGLRSGTESVPLVWAFARACERAVEGQAEASERLRVLRNRLWEGLQRHVVGGLLLNGPESPEQVSPAILSVSFQGVQSAELRERLCAEGLYVSGGAACHAGAGTMSHVHRALGFEPDRSAGTVRFGLSVHTTAREIDAAISLVAARMAGLRRVAVHE